jgi:hypothetical protein
MPTHVAQHAETTTTTLKSAHKGLFAGVTIQVDLWLAAFIRLRMVQDIEVHTFKLLGRLNPFPQ